ncbi:cytochrome-c peroxidase [Aquisphaera insulae]|uniref:cytochrome-c peroxidase n=1 Tax=Aquisphaera insulae TaxID=2712864 RepID=UPI0013EBAC19|nr:cytochrome c peroxidase [Aquisphaera insulae]
MRDRSVPVVDSGKFCIFASLALAAGLSLLSAAALADDGDDAALLAKAREAFPTLPRDAATEGHPVTPERVRLGRMLFFDTRASSDGTTSCSRCHMPGFQGCDALPTSIGAKGFVTPRNAATVFYSALHNSIHWDGRFATVEDQAGAAIGGPAFGNKGEKEPMDRLKAIPGYEALFRAAFPADGEPINARNYGTAVGAFERTLVAPSRFDDYLSGKPEALTQAERAGLRLFLETGCADCHKGPGVGGRSFRKFGVFSDYRRATGSKKDDKGRFGVTKKEADVDVFKVAGLRDVAATPPYFHDGSVRTLSDAVRIMAKVQLDAELSEADARSIAAFLGSLTGPIPASFVEPTPLPPAGFVETPAAAPAQGS